jgi:hypothetical protein
MTPYRTIFVPLAAIEALHIEQVVGGEGLCKEYTNLIQSFF